jgi:ribosome recycling factor
MAEKSRARESSRESRASDMGAAAAAPAERRKRVALRRLIDEMLAEIRAAASEENWTQDARSQAESDLARIMDQVRREAMRAEPKPKAKRAKPR